MANHKFTKRKDFLPIARPSIGKEEIREVTNILKKGWLTTGPQTHRFEEIFRKYIGSRHAVALNSCTSALHLAMVASGVGGGDEVILSAMTFVSQANSIVHLGAKPVFADIRASTLNIDPEEVARKVTDKTKAIIVTHFAGQPCERDRILKIASLRKIAVIEDAAHALGAEWHGKKIGHDPDTITCFSFYPIKNITTAEGGILTCGADDVASRVRLLGLHGLSKGAWARYTGKGSWEYDVSEPGYKYNIPDILSALGIAQMKKLDRMNLKREKLVKTYMNALGGLEEIEIPYVIDGIRHAWQIFPVLLRKKALIDRNSLIEELKKLNVGTSVHFKPIHLFRFYREAFGSKEGDLPVSEEVFKRTLSLPLFPDMDAKDCLYVAEAIKQILRKKSL